MQHYVLDIETLAIAPTHEVIKAQEARLAKRYKQQKTIDEHLAKFVENFTFNDLRGARICCIGVGVISGGKLEDVATYCSEKPHELADFLDDWMKENIPPGSEVKQVGFNNKEFDWPRLALMYQALGRSFPHPVGRYSLIDLKLEGLAASKRWEFSLASLAELLQLDHHWSSDVDGSAIAGLWASGRRDEIATYCREDVIVTGECFIKQNLTFKF